MLIIPNCFIEGISARTQVYPLKAANGRPENPYAEDADPVSGTQAYFAGADATGAAGAAKYGQMYTYDAARFDAAGKMLSPNNGPLGNLDRPVGGLGSITAGIVVRKMD